MFKLVFGGEASVMQGPDTLNDSRDVLVIDFLEEVVSCFGIRERVSELLIGGRSLFLLCLCFLAFGSSYELFLLAFFPFCFVVWFFNEFFLANFFVAPDLFAALLFPFSADDGIVAYPSISVFLPRSSAQTARRLLVEIIFEDIPSSLPFLVGLPSLPLLLSSNLNIRLSLMLGLFQRFPLLQR
jgi:hypothetical protein